MARILVVEDEPNIRELLKTVLQLEGHDVDLASDGTAGLERALANPPNLAIVDLMMPGINGLDLARMIRKNHRTAHLPLMMLTAYDGARDASLEVVDEFLQKPLRLGDLKRRVAALLAAGPRMRSDQTLRTLSYLEELDAVLEHPNEG